MEQVASKTPSKSEGVCWAVALYDYAKVADSDMNITAGEVLLILERYGDDGGGDDGSRIDDDWFTGRKVSDKTEGTFPVTYVDVLAVPVTTPGDIVALMSSTPPVLPRGGAAPDISELSESYSPTEGVALYEYTTEVCTVITIITYSGRAS